MKSPKLIIDPQKPFDLCQLGRDKYGDILTRIVKNYSEGFVLAINNEWGAGKTTFIEMWQAHLQMQGLRTIHFNAWENDFDNQPFAALLGELKSIIYNDSKNENTTTDFNAMLKASVVLAKSAFPIITKAIIEKYIGSNTLADISEKLADNAIAILENEVDEYSRKKAGVADFKLKLTEYIKSSSPDKPVVFIIDELDRCRPNYAVEVLEQVKHFFSVPGIVFVLSIDKDQLGHAIRGVYGSEGINTEEYLRRFIDIEFKLPAPLPKTFVKYLCSTYGFSNYFKSIGRSDAYSTKHELSELIDFCSILFEGQNLSLRFQEKVFSQARLALSCLDNRERFAPALFITLVFIRLKHEKLFALIQQKQLSESQLLEEFQKVIPKIFPENVRTSIWYVEGQLLLFYSNYIKEPGAQKLVSIDQKGQIVSQGSFSSMFDNSPNQSRFLKYMFELSEGDFRSFSIQSLLDKISLTEDIF